MSHYTVIHSAMALLLLLSSALVPAAAASPSLAISTAIQPASPEATTASPQPEPTPASSHRFIAATKAATEGATPTEAEDFLIRPDGAAGSSAGGPAATGDPTISAQYPPPTWRWRRSGIADYLGVALLGAGAIYVETAHGDPKPKWKGINGFDDAVRDALRLRSDGAREVAQDVSDALMYGMIAAPVLDSFATLGLRDGAWDTLWQTEMINLESFAFTSFVSSLVQNLVAREKPFAHHCKSGVCEGDQPNRSMPSGHAAFAFTGAGLVCNHHEYQSLYRDAAADRAACWTGMGFAVADGLARIMADHHYATDVAAGAAIGLFSGYLLPRLLHYNHLERPGSEATGSSSAIGRLSFRPLVSAGSAGLACDVRF